MREPYSRVRLKRRYYDGEKWRYVYVREARTKEHSDVIFWTKEEVWRGILMLEGCLKKRESVRGSKNQTIEFYRRYKRNGKRKEKKID